MVVVAGLALVAVSLLSLFRLHQLRGRQLRDSTFLIGLVVAFVFQLVQGVLAMNRPEDSRVVGTIAVLVVICSRVGIGRALVRPTAGDAAAEDTGSV